MGWFFVMCAKVTAREAVEPDAGGREEISAEPLLAVAMGRLSPALVVTRVQPAPTGWSA